MKTKHLILLAAATIIFLNPVKAAYNIKEDPRYKELRDSMSRAFNDADSARFFPIIYRLEEYCLSKNDMHSYYTQRCNEIVFLMNQQRIYEAYMLAYKLSSELREKGLEKEMYMAYNMLGHINRYCGNNATAKENFYHVLSEMEKYGYWESMPPIYMNLVNVELDDDPDEAIRLLERAKEIALKYAPERVFDIETRKILSYYNRGDIPRFLEGFKEYKKGIDEGKSTVHGRTMEVYYLAATGKTDEAVALATKELGDEGGEAISLIYEHAGRWEDAYKSLHKHYTSQDSIANVVLINSMQGIREQLSLFEAEKKTTRAKFIGLTVGIVLLILLVAALMYIVISRRRHVAQLQEAYNRALEADRMKKAFIQNVSHEVRTPLNIISGFAQIIADPELANSTEERKHMADTMQRNTLQVTSLIDEVLELSLSESSKVAAKEDEISINALLNELIGDHHGLMKPGVEMTLDSPLPDNYTILTNRTLLKRAIATLIDNAVKNTTQGSITLKTKAKENSVLIAVQDTGSGIPKEEADHIFDRFVKLDSFKEGLGLGLPLCRTLVERLGGTVRLDTNYGPGARFIIELTNNKK